jgi:AraC-like DNA-binding protein
MLIPVSAGERFGTVIRARQAGDFLLRESRYDAAVRMPTHHHPQAYFCFVFRGGLLEQRDGAEFRFEPGSLHFHPALEPHAVSVGPEGATCLSIIPHGSIAERLASLRPGTTMWVTLDRLGGLARHCWSAFHADDTASELGLEAAALELVAAWLRLPDPPAAIPPDWLAEVRRHLDDHHQQRIVMRDLAGVAGIHAVHLIRAFRRHFGVTPGAYLRRRRIDWARRTLVDTADPLADVALAAGFSSQAHFTRVFRREVGVTPGAYRRNGRPSGQNPRFKPVNRFTP